MASHWWPLSSGKTNARTSHFACTVLAGQRHGCKDCIQPGCIAEPVFPTSTPGSSPLCSDILQRLHRPKLDNETVRALRRLRSLCRPSPTSQASSRSCVQRVLGIVLRLLENRPRSFENLLPHMLGCLLKGLRHNSVHEGWQTAACFRSCLANVFGG